MSSELTADCSQCAGLCCVAPAFSASADFAIDKPAGTPCPNLRTDFRCGIHDRLRDSGFAGCTVFDCFGAGQQVTQVTFGGRNWRTSPEIARPMFASFAVMRNLHELLWYLTEALALAPSLHDEVTGEVEKVSALTRGDAEALASVDIAELRGEANAVLVRVSELVRGNGPDYRGAELIGADLRGADLRSANLRGARLIGANLRMVDLRGADFTGADFRGADIRAANFTGAIFLIQAQLDAAKGDVATVLPPALSRPTHWLL